MCSEIRTTSQKKQVCIYWVRGRCNRKPCRFLHRESLPSETEQQPHLAPRKRTWKNPNCDVPKFVKDEPEKRFTPKAPLKQCKNWVASNCVHGEKCKDLHSWFSGSGFTMLAKLEGHTEPVTGICLPSGSDKLYSGSKDGTLRVWDCKTGQYVGSVMFDGEVGCLTTEGPWLFAGLQNGLKGWNLENQTECSINEDVGSVTSMVADEDLVFAGMQDGTIMVWKWSSESNIHKPAHMLNGHDGAVCSLVIGAARLYSGSRDCTIKVWELQNMQCLQTLYGHSRDVTAVICWSRYLLSASLDKTLKIWCANETGAIKMAYEIEDDHELLALSGIHDEEGNAILLCSFGDRTVRLYDLPSFEEKGRIFSKDPVEVIQIGPQGLFFTGEATGEVFVWKLLGSPSATPS